MEHCEHCESGDYFDDGDEKTCLCIYGCHLDIMTEDCYLADLKSSDKVFDLKSFDKKSASDLKSSDK